MYVYMLYTTMLVCKIAQVRGQVAPDNPGVADNVERLAYEDIFRDYDSTIRPRNLPTEVVEVTIQLYLRSLSGFDAVNQIIHNQIVVFATWKDDFLQWGLTQYGGPLPYIVVPATKVWRPDFGVQNSATDFYKENYWRDYRVKIDFQGNVFWSFGGVFDTSCSLKISDYPFDEQECNITISNWAYLIDDVVLRCEDISMDTSDYSEDGLWKLKDTACSDKPDEAAPGVILSRITYSLLYQRKIFWYTLNIIIPSLLMVILVLMMFWLPADSGEKIGMGVTMLLAFSVFMLLIASEIPKTSDTTPMLSAVMIFVMSITTLSIINSIVVLRFHHHSSTRRPPKVIRYVAFSILARVMCLTYLLPEDYGKVTSSGANSENSLNTKSESLESMTYESKKNEAGDGSVRQVAPVMPGGEMSEILHHVEGIKDILKDDVDSSSTRDEWQDIAAIFERAMFWMVLVVTLIYIPYMFIHASVH